MRIIMKDGTEIKLILVIGGKEYIQGANRDVLTFVFNETSLDEIDKIFTEKNCEGIKIIGEDGEEFIHSGYVIRVSLEKKKVEIEPETAEYEAEYEERVFVKMAQRIYAESKLIQIEAQGLDTALAVAELGTMIAGGTV